MKAVMTNTNQFFNAQTTVFRLKTASTKIKQLAAQPPRLLSVILVVFVMTFIIQFAYSSMSTTEHFSFSVFDGLFWKVITTCFLISSLMSFYFLKSKRKS